MRIWISAIVLSLGDALMQMGLLEYFRAHGYDVQTETARLLFAVSFPGALLGLLAMAYLDRWQRRSVLMICDVLRAVTVVVIAMWLLPVIAGRLESRGLMAVYAMIFLNGAITTFYYPARYALLPNLVGNDVLVQANTLMTTCLAVASVGGRAVGGLIAEKMGVEWAVLANALAYIASVALVWSIQMKPHATTGGANTHPQGGWGEMKAGMDYLWTHTTALPLVMLAGALAFMGAVFIVAFVGYAMETLHLRTGGLGYLFVALGIGGAVGMITIGRAKRLVHYAWLPFAELIVGGAMLTLMSTITSVWPAAVMLMVLAAVGAPLMILLDAKLQEQVGDQRRGAVFAARGMLTSVTMVVAFWLQFGTKLLRDTPPPTILLWLGIGSMVVAGLALLAMRVRSNNEAAESNV